MLRRAQVGTVGEERRNIPALAAKNGALLYVASTTDRTQEFEKRGVHESTVLYQYLRYVKAGNIYVTIE
jgi:hypothetical protein